MTKAREKGIRAEQGMVRYLTKNGIWADRVPLSGAVKGYKGDIRLGRHGSPIDLKAEVKARKDGLGFGLIKRWLGDNFCLFLKQDRTPVLVTLRLEDFVKIYKAYQDLHMDSLAEAHNEHPSKSLGKTLQQDPPF